MSDDNPKPRISVSDASVFFVERRIGRPPRMGVRSTRRIEFVVTDQEHAALCRVAQENQQPLASVIRDAVNTFVADYSDRVVFSGKK